MTNKISARILCLVLSMASLSTATATDTPNIVLILADDLGYGDVSCYNDQAKKQKGSEKTKRVRSIKKQKGSGAYMKTGKLKASPKNQFGS